MSATGVLETLYGLAVGATFGLVALFGALALVGCSVAIVRVFCRRRK